MADAKRDTNSRQSDTDENQGVSRLFDPSSDHRLSPLSPEGDTVSQDDRWALSEETVARWFASQSAAEIPAECWTVEEVEDRLISAIRYAQRTGGRAGPKIFGSAWPDYQYDWADRLAQQSRSEAEQAEEDQERNRTRLSFSSRQVTLAEAALGWAATYVVKEQDRQALAIWMLAKATRRNWQDLAASRGIARETAKRRKARAIHAIILGLTRDLVAVETGR